MLQLNQQELSRLQRLNQDKSTVECLKKLFLNAFTKKAPVPNVEVLAAERMAIHLLDEGFKELSRIQVDKGEKNVSENLI